MTHNVVSENDRHWILACKGHYGDEGLKRVYEKLYARPYEENQGIVYDRLLEVIWSYGVLATERDFKRFAGKLISRGTFELLANERSITYQELLERAIDIAAAHISIWPVERDGVRYELGQADLFGGVKE